MLIPDSNGLTQDKLDRYWKHFEDEVDLSRAADIMEEIEEGKGITLLPADAAIVVRALAVAVSETAIRQLNRESPE